MCAFALTRPHPPRPPPFSVCTLWMVPGDKFLGGKFMGDCSKWGTNDQIMPKRKKFHKICLFQ